MLDFSNFVQQAEQARQSSLATSSQTTHLNALRPYENTMQKVFGLDGYPLTEDKMQGFLMYKKQQGCLFNTLMGYVRAFSWDLRRKELPVLTSSIKFKTFRDTLRREMHGGECPNQKAPMPREFFTEFLKTYGVALRDHRLFFLASLAFNFFLRISEVLELEKRDLRLIEERGLLELTVRRSKSDQFAEGVKCYIPVTKDEVSPVQFLDVLERMGAGDRLVVLTPAALNSRLKSYLAGLGYDCQKFSWHSFRRGGAYLASINGVQDCVIKKHGRWSSDAYLRYVAVEPIHAGEEVFKALHT